MTLRLPGDLTENYTVDAHTDLENYSDRLRVAMSRQISIPPGQISIPSGQISNPPGQISNPPGQIIICSGLDIFFMVAVPGFRTSMTRVCMKQNLNARSTIMTKETVPADNQRGEKTEEQSNKRAILHKAPHARMAITSRANGRNEDLRTYSRIPLHLRKDVPVGIPQNTHTDNRNDSNADKNSTAITRKKLDNFYFNFALGWI